MLSKLRRRRVGLVLRAVDTGRVLGLRRAKIDDEKWLRAMAAIGDSIQVAGSKPYIRFYERDANGVYQAINLDMAAV